MSFNKEMEQDALLSEDANRSSFSDSNVESQTETHPFIQPPRKATFSNLFSWQAILIHTGIFIVYTILMLLLVVPVWNSREREVAYSKLSNPLFSFLLTQSYQSRLILDHRLRSSSTNTRSMLANRHPS